MGKKTARFLFLGICLILAVLLLTNTISPLVSGLIFAISLVTLGIASKGFWK